MDEQPYVEIRQRYLYEHCPYCGSGDLHWFQKLRFAYEWRRRCLSCKRDLGNEFEQDAAIRQQLANGEVVA